MHLNAAWCAQSLTRPTSTPATLRNIMQGRMQPLPSHVTPSCAALIRSLLSVDPSSRPSLEEVLQHPWLHENLSSIDGVASQPLQPYMAAWQASCSPPSSEAKAAGLAESNLPLGSCVQQAKLPGQPARPDGASRCQRPSISKAWDAGAAPATSKVAAAVGFTADCRSSDLQLI